MIQCSHDAMRSRSSSLLQGATAFSVTLDELNSVSGRRFVERLGGVFEHSPWVAAEAAKARPFTSLSALHLAMVAAVRASEETKQLELIRAHPDLAGKAARAGELSVDSKQEQAGAGLDRLSEEEYRRFHELNAAYKERFDFPFIIAVRGHTKESILGAFAERLRNSRDTEKRRALAEIAKIARFRLDALIKG